jgi:hypothetical protein
VKRLLMAMTLASSLIVGTVAPAQAAFSGLPSTSVDTSYPQGDSLASEAARNVLSIDTGTNYVVLGGPFQQMGGSTRTYLAFVNKSDNSLDDTAFTIVKDTGVDEKRVVTAVNIEQNADQDVWIGGQIATVGGTAVEDVVRFDRNGSDTYTLDTNFNPPDDLDNVFSIDKTQDGLYVAADSGIYSLDPDTGAQNWQVEYTFDCSVGVSGGCSGQARVFAVDARNADDVVLVAGNFSELTSPVNGAKTRDLAALLDEADGRIKTTWDPNWPTSGYASCGSAPCYPEDGSGPQIWDAELSPDGNHVVLGAGGDAPRGGNGARIWTLDSLTPEDPTCRAISPDWNTGGDTGNAQGVAATDEYVFVAHHGDGDNDNSPPQDDKIYVADIDDCADANWNPSTNFGSSIGLFAAEVDDEALYLGGATTTPRTSLNVFNDV